MFLDEVQEIPLTREKNYTNLSLRRRGGSSPPVEERVDCRVESPPDWRRQLMALVRRMFRLSRRCEESRLEPPQPTLRLPNFTTRHYDP